MPAFERFFMPACSEGPACRCGEKMQLTCINPLPATPDVHIRVYNCAACSHEMRLTVWADADSVSGSVVSDKTTSTGSQAITDREISRISPLKF